MCNFRRMVLGAVVGMALVPGVYAASPVTMGFDLTTEGKFEHRYFDAYGGEPRMVTIRVNPLSCVEFGRGARDSLTIKINEQYSTVYRDGSDLSESVHTLVCEQALRVGQSLDPLMWPESKRERDNPVYVEKYTDTNTTRIGMRVRPMDNIDMKGKHPMSIHYEEKGVAKTLYFPLTACANPDAEGEIIMNEGGHQVHESLSSVAKTPKLNLLLAKACMAMVVPYVFIKENPKLYQPARQIVINAHAKLYPLNALFTMPMSSKFYPQ